MYGLRSSGLPSAVRGAFGPAGAVDGARELGGASTPFQSARRTPGRPTDGASASTVLAVTASNPAAVAGSPERVDFIGNPLFAGGGGGGGLGRSGRVAPLRGGEIGQGVEQRQAAARRG